MGQVQTSRLPFTRTRRWNLRGIFSMFNFKRLHSSSPPRRKQGVAEIDLPEVSATLPSTPCAEEGGNHEKPVGYFPGPFDPYADFDAIHDMENVDNLDSGRGYCNFFRDFLTCFLREAKRASMRGRDTEGLTPVPWRVWRSSRGLGAVEHSVI
ncbi:unnamed protein product [Ascophyllum nodosum]